MRFDFKTFEFMKVYENKTIFFFVHEWLSLINDVSTEVFLNKLKQWCSLCHQQSTIESY